jgi:hypothetical protein
MRLGFMLPKFAPEATVAARDRAGRGRGRLGWRRVTKQKRTKGKVRERKDHVEVLAHVRVVDPMVALEELEEA